MLREGRRKQAPTWGPGAFVVQPGAKLALACFDEGILPLSLPHSRLYGEIL